MQGSNTSRIGMARQRQSWDDSSWGGNGSGKQNTKARDAKKEHARTMRRQAQQQRDDSIETL